MGVTRTTLLSGPAAVSYAGHIYWAREGVVVSPALELAAVESDAEGVLDSTVVDSPVTIRFVPSVPARDLVALYPHLDGAVGKSLFGAADVPLVITASNGVRLTFAAVALVQMPDLHLGVDGDGVGTVSFLALPARGSSVNSPGRVVTFDTATLPAMPASSPQLTDDYVLFWGVKAPAPALRSLDGFHVSFSLKTEPVLSDANGVLDVTLVSLAVEVIFMPEARAGGPWDAEALNGFLIAADPGHALSASSRMLGLIGDSFSLFLPEAALVRAGVIFSGTADRMTAVVFAAGQGFTGEGRAALAEVAA